jgi:hypothetical protein
LVALGAQFVVDPLRWADLVEHLLWWEALAAQQRLLGR